MSHNNTVFSQLLKLIPRHEFETLAKQHHSGRSFKTACTGQVIGYSGQVDHLFWNKLISDSGLS